MVLLFFVQYVLVSVILCGPVMANAVRVNADARGYSTRI